MVAATPETASKAESSPHAAARKLNIGCGAFRIEGYLNLDADPRAKPDVVYDLNDFPYPFPAESFELIEANHILEHLDDPFKVMKELHRLLIKGGRLVVRVPHFSRGFTHAEHKRGFDVTFPYYFNASFPGGFTGVEFDLQEMKMVWFSQPYLKKLVLSKPQYYFGSAIGTLIDFFANLSPVFCSRVWCFVVGGFEEVEFHFARK